VEPYEQQRTKRRAIARLAELVHEQAAPRSDSYVSVMHVEAEEEAAQLAADIAGRLGLQDIPLYVLPPAIVVHGGPRALAVGFFAPVV
jgi:fatty acid-binding protein DegV